MAIFNTVAFGDFDPVTGPPTIDGWTGNEDPGVDHQLRRGGVCDWRTADLRRRRGGAAGGLPVRAHDASSQARRCR